MYMRPASRVHLWGAYLTAKGKEVGFQGWKEIERLSRSSSERETRGDDLEDVAPPGTLLGADIRTMYATTEHFTTPPKPLYGGYPVCYGARRVRDNMLDDERKAWHTCHQGLPSLKS